MFPANYKVKEKTATCHNPELRPPHLKTPRGRQYSCNIGHHVPIFAMSLRDIQLYPRDSCNFILVNTTQVFNTALINLQKLP